MFRTFRMKRKNRLTGLWDILLPQTVTENILRSKDATTLESNLSQYDDHITNVVSHINRATTAGTCRALSVTLDGVVLTDGLPLLLTLHDNLDCEPTLSFNGGTPYKIISASGDYIPGGQVKGSTIFIVWNKGLQSWVLMSAANFNDITKIVLPVETEYVYTATANNTSVITIPNFNRKADKLSVNFGQTILRHGIDYEYVLSSNDSIRLLGYSLGAGDILVFTIISYITTAKQGHFRYDLKATDYTVTIPADNTTTIAVPSAASGAHSVVVNYNQTILRNNLDYSYTEDGSAIVLKNITLNKDETLVFTITEFIEAPGEYVPNNWGATGNYRYSYNVIHGNYTATENATTVFVIPKYNFKCDDLSLIKDNKLYIEDVDYAIDEIGEVVLLQSQLNAGDKIYFTIRQGGMADVPDFNVITDSGKDGQHLELNMNYSILSNWYMLLIKLKNDLLTAPTIKCMDGPAEVICDCYKAPILGGYKAGSYLWVVYDKDSHLWYSLSHSQLDVSTLVPQHKHTSGKANFSGQPVAGVTSETTIEHNLGVKPERIDIIPCEAPTDSDGNLVGIGDIWSYADATHLYVGNSGKATSRFSWAVTSEDDTTDLRSYIDQEVESLKKRPGTITTFLSAFTATEDNTTQISSIANYTAGVDKLIVNFNQTILREGIDYLVNADIGGITLINIKLKVGDILQFTIFDQETPSI